MNKNEFAAAYNAKKKPSAQNLNNRKQFAQAYDAKKLQSRRKTLKDKEIRVSEIPEEYKQYLSAPDFKEYADKGAAIENPTYDEYYGAISIGEWRPFSKEIGNIVTFSQQNKDRILQNAHSMKSGVGNAGYNDLTAEEASVYNYLLGKGDNEKAADYLKVLDDITNRRQGKKIADNAKGDKLAESLYSVVAGMENFGAGINNIDNYIRGAKGDTPSALSYASSYIRDDMEKDGWGWVYDTGAAVGNMLPAIVATAITGGVGASSAVASGVGAASMGVSASGNAYSEMRRAGYDEWQSRGYGALVGASESALQYILGGIGSLGSKGLQRVGGKALGNLLSKFDNALVKVAVKVGKSSAGQLLASAASEGIEEGLQAVLEPLYKALVTGEKFEAAEWDEIIYNALLGVLSAGVLEGTSTLVNSQRERIADTKAGRSIIELAGAKSELYDAANLSTSEDTKKLLERAAKAKKGSGKEARLTAQLARSVGAEYRDQTADYMTPEEIAAIEGDEAVARYEAEKTDFERKTEKYIEKQSKAYEKVAESNATVANIGLKSKPIAPSKKYNPETRDVYNYGRLEYNGDPREYDLYFEMARNLGLNADGRSFTDMFNTLSETDRKGMLTLDSDVIRAAFDDGVTTVQKIKQEQAAKDEIKKRAKEIEDAKAKKADEEHSNVEGNKTDENADVEENETEEVDKSNFLIDKSVNQDELNRTQRTAIERIRKLAEYLDGVSFRITNTLGEIDGNGYYDKENKTVVININAGKIGDPQGVFDFAVDAAWTHEIGHYIKEKSPQKFEEIKAFIKKEFYQYDAWDGAVEMRLDQYRAQLGKSADEFTFEMAEEEVVCNSLGKMLTSKRVMKRLAGEHRSAFGTIWRFVRDFFEKLIGKISGYGRLDKFSYRTAEEEIVLDGAKRKRDKLEKMFADALVDANTTAKAEQTVEYATKSKTAQNSENSGLTNTNEQNVHVSGENNYNPSSIKNTEVKKDVKFSLVDREYLAAVERGDMEAAQAMVDEAAKAAGYTDKLYHGTHQFGFTEFDPSYSDDKISLFVAGSPDISQTYSGRYGTRKISDAYKVDGLTIAEVVERLNKEAHESYDGEQLKIEYEIMYLQDVNRVINEVNDGVDWLSELVGKKIKEYAERMATDFDDKDAKTHKKLVELKEILDNYQYEYMSTPIYMLLHYTDAFDDGARVADLEYKIRLMNKLRNADTRNGVVVKKDLDGYGVSILYFDEAMLELKQRNAEGNYALYGNPRNQLVIDGGGQNWNDLRGWAKAIHHTLDNTVVERKGDYYRLYDKKTGNEIFHGRLAVNTYTEGLSARMRHIQMIEKSNNVLDARAEYHHTTRDIARFAKDLGYESVKFENIEDNGGQGESVGAGDVYAYFEPSNLKSADPVVYDDSGNVIPLSERFNPAKKDIRYSLPYDHAIDKLDNGTLDITKNTHLKLLEHTPQIYIDKASASDRVMVMSWEVAYLAMNKNGTIPGNYHGLGVEVMKALPTALEDPLYIIKQKNGRIAAVTKIVVKGKRAVFASIELEAYQTTIQDGEPETKQYNLVVTVTDAKPNYLQNTIFSGEIVHNKNSEDPAHFILRLKSLEKAVPTYDLAGSSDNSIPDSDEKINPSGEIFSKKYSLTDRELREKLAESFYGMAESDEERKAVEKYRSELNKVDEWMGERQQLIAEFEELRGVTGKSKERTEINKRIIVLNESITRHDEKLLKIAAAKPFRDVIDRYEAKAFEEGAAKSEGEVRMSAGQFKKMIADYTKPKVYSKSDAERAISSLEAANGVKGKKRVALVDEIWQGLNDAATDAERIQFVQKMSEKVYDAIITESRSENPEYQSYAERMDYLRQYTGRLTFSDDVMAEIKAKYDKQGTKFFLGRWQNKTNDGSSIGADVFVTDFARENPGYEYLEEMPVQDALFEINELYNDAVNADKTVGTFDEANAGELSALRSSIVDSILTAFDKGGEKSKAAKNYTLARADYFKNELENVIAINKEKINLDRIARKLRDKKYGTFQNATQIDTAPLSDLLRELSAFNYRGTISVNNVRDKVRALLSWYSTDNVMLEYRDPANPGYYNQEVHDILESLSSGKGDLSLIEYRQLYELLSYFDKFVDSYNKVWKNGKWIEAKEEAERFVGIIRENQKQRVGWVDHLIRNKFIELFGDPMAVARSMDYYQHGFYTTMMEYLRECTVKAQVAEMEMLSDYNAFLEKHPDYLKKAALETVRYDHFNIEEAKPERHFIPKLEIISLYMTLKRQHAVLGFAFNGFKYDDLSGDAVRVSGIIADPETDYEIIEAQVDEVRNKIAKSLSKADMEYISILESVYNNDAKELKRRRDMERLGFSNVSDGYYYPIRRSDTATSVDSGEMQAELDRVSNASFNKDIVKGARHKLMIESADDLFRRHVRVICQYGYMQEAIEYYDKVYHVTVNDNRNNPKSIATETENWWRNADRYFRDLIAYVQGVRPKTSEGMQLFNTIRSGYAKYQLGANPKVWVTQLSSFVAACNIIDVSSLLESANVKADDVDVYCKLAKLRNEDNTAALAQGVFDRTTKAAAAERAVSKLGDVLMTPIGMMDRFVVKRLYAACQVQVAKDGGGAVGTVKNKKAAGELLERVILETQQNAMGTEKSWAMRSSNEILRGFTMFSADGMKLLARFIDAVGEAFVLHNRIAHSKGAERAKYEKRMKVVIGKIGRGIGTLVGSSVFMVLVGMLFKHIYARDDEITLENAANDLFGNLIGGLPVIRDVYSVIFDGYDLENFAYSVFNDIVNGFPKLVKSIVDWFNGGDPTAISRSFKSFVYSVGQLTGIPMRNIYNAIYGSIKRFFPQIAGNIDDFFSY